MLRASLSSMVVSPHPGATTTAVEACRGVPGVRITFGVYALAVVAFWTLICARGYQAPPAGEMSQLLGVHWRLPLAHDAHLLLFAICAVALVLAWMLAARAAAHADVGIGGVLAGAAALGIPFVLLTGIYSDDVYLYHLYGKELVHYGANPLLTAPSAFATDPHLKWVYWKWLPSAYGPLWLLISAPLSASAGASITAAVILYRMAGLAAHVAAAWVIWKAVGRTFPPRAVGAAVFFAWNPFLLFESVASAHNDAVVALCIALAVWAISAGRWALAAVAIASAVMVKPFVGLLMGPLLVAAWVNLPQRDRIRGVLTVTGAAVITAAALYLPFRAGDAIVRNALQNPAAVVYMNSLWEFAAFQLAGTAQPARASLEAARLDPLRLWLLCATLLGTLYAAARLKDFTRSGILLWIGFCLSLSWVWPWYFVPAVTLAAFAGRGAQPLVVAMSLGGLLFYLGWPPPPRHLGWMYTGRSVLLFGPLLVALAVLAARWGNAHLHSRERPFVGKLRDALVGGSEVV